MPSYDIMTTIKDKLFESILRFIEVVLLFATVVLMYRGYHLQSETYKLSIRPYISLAPRPDNFAVQVAADLYELVFDVENIGSFPARDSINYGVIVADGKVIDAINCNVLFDNGRFPRIVEKI